MDLKYHCPQLGKVAVRLYTPADKCYELLEKQGHIKRLQNIDQLGVIRGAYGGAHHTRWEYVMVQLWIIHMLTIVKDELTGQKSANGMGLVTPVKGLIGTPSGSALMQMWALMLNSGHLAGTFASERGFLRALKADTSLKDVISRGLPCDRMRDYLNQILEKEDEYSIHKILSSFHLQRYARREAPLVNELNNYLCYYIFGAEINSKTDGEKTDRLRHIFYRIRQLAYLFLDSQYSPIPLSFSLSQIFLNLTDYCPIIFGDRRNQTIKTMQSLEDLLAANIYHSPESSREFGKHEAAVMTILRKEKSLSTINGLHHFLLNTAKLEPKATSWGIAPCIHLCFELTEMYVYFLPFFKKHLSLDIESSLNKSKDMKKCRVTVQWSAKSELFTINVACSPNCNVSQTSRVMANLLSKLYLLLLAIRKEISDKDKELTNAGIVEMVFARPLESMTLQALTCLVKQQSSFSFKKTDRRKSSVLFIKGAVKAAKELKPSMDNCQDDNSRKIELKALSEALIQINNRSPIIVCTDQVLVRNKDGNDATDLDGLCVGIKNGKLFILVVEAKDTKEGRFSKAEKQLTNSLNAINFKSRSSPNIKRTTNGVYAVINIDR